MLIVCGRASQVCLRTGQTAWTASWEPDGRGQDQPIDVKRTAPARASRIIRRAPVHDHKFAVPSKDGVGCDDLGHFLQGLLAELLANLSQCLALAITQLDASLDVIAEHAVFSHQVLIAQQEFLIDRPRDIRQ